MKILKDKGYWAHFVTPNKSGSQPCDIIAIKDDRPILIDCKTSYSNLFPIRRIEENQRQAFKRFSQCGNTKYILAIKYENEIYEIDMSTIDFTQKNIDLRKEEKFENNS